VLDEGGGYFKRIKTDCIHPIKLSVAPNGVTLKKTRNLANEDGIIDELNDPRKNQTDMDHENDESI
jgi:hypothetical protein